MKLYTLVEHQEDNNKLWNIDDEKEHQNNGTIQEKRKHTLIFICLNIRIVDTLLTLFLFKDIIIMEELNQDQNNDNNIAKIWWNHNHEEKENVVELLNFQNHGNCDPFICHLDKTNEKYNDDDKEEYFKEYQNNHSNGIILISKIMDKEDKNNNNTLANIAKVCIRKDDPTNEDVYHSFRINDELSKRSIATIIMKDDHQYNHYDYYFNLILLGNNYKNEWTGHAREKWLW